MYKQNEAQYQRAIDFLTQRTNYETFKSVPYDQMAGSLERLKRFLTFLGRPDQNYAIIHVAGTKGKGTTCAALDQIYRTAGYRVGLFTSPHLDDLRERFQINGQNCDKNIFAETVCELQKKWDDFLEKERVERVDAAPSGAANQLTFFDWSLVVALTLFARAKVDVAILEVGMGGRFDSTNACFADVSVLTSVSFDHCEQLGATIEAIAREKLGIVKSNAPLVCGAGFSGSLYDGLDDYRRRLASVDRQKFYSGGRGASKKETSASGKSVVAAGASDDVRLTQIAPLFVIGDGIRQEDYQFAVDPETIVTHDDVETVRKMAEETARAHNAPFVGVESISPLVASLPSPPLDSVWRWNFEIAVRAVETLASRLVAPEGRPGAGSPDEVRRFPVSDAAVRVAASSFRIPARCEVVSASPLVVVDGAHNRASVAALLRQVRERWPEKKIDVLFATTLGKDVRGMLAELAARADDVYLSERDQGGRALSIRELVAVFTELMKTTCPADSPLTRKFHVAPDFKAFLLKYVVENTGKNSVLCVTGSFYFAANVRRGLLKRFESLNG